MSVGWLIANVLMLRVVIPIAAGRITCWRGRGRIDCGCANVQMESGCAPHALGIAVAQRRR